ncbi:hypothetical protein, partial [Kistimonas scapharcae]|uniref:hypothetical protein n=1 Tax=Kistimonas scapharcae TaxID=1036133 RepID=UPI0031F0FA3B
YESMSGSNILRIFRLGSRLSMKRQQPLGVYRHLSNIRNKESVFGLLFVMLNSGLFYLVKKPPELGGNG